MSKVEVVESPEEKVELAPADEPQPMSREELDERDATSAPVESHEPARVVYYNEEVPYVHIPGTVHLNAFVAAVDEAKTKVRLAEGELAEAERALENKKIEAGLL